jgi:integrase
LFWQTFEQTKSLSAMRQKLVILPKLNDCHGDTDKQWFVYYSVRNPRTNKMERFRIYDGFTGLSGEEKRRHAMQLIEVYSARLKTGWTPFKDDSKALYTDQIEYRTVADMFGQKRKANNTFRRWISQLLEEEQAGIRGTTLTTYRSKYRIFTLWLEKNGHGDNDLTCIDNKVMITFFKYLIDTRKLSGKSIRYYKMILAHAFEYFRKQKLIMINPVYDIPPCNRINDCTPRPIQRPDIKLFKKAMLKDPELTLGMKFMYYCGMRPGHEIRELQIKEIDFIAGTIHVIRGNAKNGRERIVTIPRQFLDEIRRLGLQKLDRNWYIFGVGGKPGPKPIDKNKFSRKFKAIREKLGMPTEYKWYSWKHTGMIEADDTGVIPDKDISTHVGHADLATTSKYFRNKKPQVSKAIRDHYPTL